MADLTNILEEDEGAGAQIDSTAFISTGLDY
ncbi:uncharacterized protein G2W53_039777 [Senna tora]|uniref:Uncharacterized protein n=1 Tax=Senna tora TaxID=362788 RepID=A0A834SQ56_9FABA|nr:uncharacterized protein G2W53_039777 [Senna tora]